MYTHTYIHTCIHTCVRTLYMCTSCSTHAPCTLRTCMHSGHKEWSESVSVKYIVCMNAPFSTRLRPTRTANAGATPVDKVIVYTREIHTNGEKKVCACNNFSMTTHTHKHIMLLLCTWGVYNLLQRFCPLFATYYKQGKPVSSMITLCTSTQNQ